MESSKKNDVFDDKTIKEILEEAKVDLNYVEDNLSDSVEDLESALHDASKKLKKNLEALAKKAKKEVKSEVLNFYHDNKAVVKDDLKTVNTYVKEILQEAKELLNEAIDQSIDKDEKKELKLIRSKVKKFSRKYSRKYAMLKLKLAVGNAEVDIKRFFS